MLNLNKVMVPDSVARTVTVEFTPGVNIEVRYLSSLALQGLIDRATVYRARKGRGRVADVDANRLAEELGAYVTGWDGMTLSKLTPFLVLKADISAEELGADIPFSREQAVEFLKHITELSQLVQETATSPDLYRNDKLEDHLGNSPSTSSGSSQTTGKSSRPAKDVSKPSAT